MPQGIDTTGGFRRPTPEEQGRIRTDWEEEIKNLPSGKGVTTAARIVGIVLTAVGASYLLKEPKQVSAAVIVLLVATVALFFSRFGKNDAKQNQRLLEALTQGDYLVAEAVPTKIWFQKTKWRTMPWVNVDIAGKTQQYRLPQSAADSLTQTHRPVVLLIRIDDCLKSIAVLRR